jgi:hypothetical protein
MIRRGLTTRRTVTTLLAIGAGVLALGDPAWSATSETQQGAQIVSEVQSNKLSGSSLSSEQYAHVGQYLMGRALGSSQRYKAMDSQMDRMMGQSVSNQMYQYMGQRYLGKSVAPNSSYAPYYSWMANMMSRYGGTYASMMGGYMMGAYNSASGQGSATDGYRMGPGMMGYGYASSQNAADTGITTGAIIGIVLGAIAVVGFLLVLLLGVTRRRAPKAGPA